MHQRERFGSSPLVPIDVIADHVAMTIYGDPLSDDDEEAYGFIPLLIAAGAAAAPAIAKAVKKAQEKHKKKLEAENPNKKTRPKGLRAHPGKSREADKEADDEEEVEEKDDLSSLESDVSAKDEEKDDLSSLESEIFGAIGDRVVNEMFGRIKR
jgi:hypothetical protein